MYIFVTNKLINYDCLLNYRFIVLFFMARLMSPSFIVAGFAIGAIFVREVFHQDSKTQAEDMINNVRNAFKKNFKNLKWMDDDTRKVAIDKADAISDMIGR